jgi:hypothetical protein
MTSYIFSLMIVEVNVYSLDFANNASLSIRTTRLNVFSISMLSTVHKNKNSRPKDGFALVISLSLMAFVLLLILSISTLVQVEISSAQINQKRLEAELNAYLGMQMALGELQKTLGPDQRVSATANLIEPKSARGHTVGVWASADVASLGQEEGDLITWLASDAVGSNGEFQADYEKQKPSSGVILVGVGSVKVQDEDEDEDGVADDLNQQVVIDLTNTSIEQNEQTVGQYAWWVSDEGTKARINLDRDQQEDKQRSVLEAGSSSVANTAALTGLENLYSDAGEPVIPLSKLNVLDDLDLIPGATDSISKDYFYDLTTWSNGVLADVKNGGLKKDLSLAFEMSDDRFNASEFAAGGASTINAPGFGRVQPVFEFKSSEFEGPAFEGTAHGPVWHLLRDYYRLYHLMDKPMTAPTLAARVFGPNVNHGEPSLALGSELTSSPVALDKQPAILFAGGKAKFFNQGYDNGPVGGGVTQFMPFRHAHPDFSKSALDFAMRDADPLRLGITGDPLRGGGSSASGTTMPVMVTGNYMPYMIRFVAEMGIWFSPYNGSVLAAGTDYVHLNEMTRETFVLHNPYNVTIDHTEVGVDCFGFDIQYSLEDPSGALEPFYKSNNGNPTDNTIQQESERQIRVGSGSFAPGAIKTYAANNYGNTSGATVELATEGANPAWHHYKFANPDTKSALVFERPAAAPIPPLTGPIGYYSLNVHGGTMHQALTNPPYHETDRYSVTAIFTATYLKQSGNSAFDGIYLRDRWPLAAVVDTALLLPGRESFSKKPGSASRMFPDSDRPDITENFINTYNTSQNSYPTATFDFQLKPANYDKLDVRYPAFARSNPLAPVKDNKNLLPADDFIANSSGFPKLEPGTDVVMDRDGVAGLANSYTRWGPTDGENGGVTNPVLIELPTSPVLSLGKLQHANISIHAHMPALAVGNSLASVYIPKNQVFTTFENYYEQERIFYDLSYLMNEALWDSYFFSSYSLPYNAGEDDYDESGSSVSEMFDTFADRTQSLPNSRMSLSPSASEGAEDLRAKLFDGNTIKINAPARAAENLMVKGSFNVNSTSVAAWRAVLSGARDSAIYQSGAAAESPLTAGNTPFSRFTQPVAGESTGSSGSDGPDEWAGFRALSDAEIESLATTIVAEIRNRVASTSPSHPYLSLSDFVNRELTNSDFGRTGVIQAAIDRAGLNNGMSSSISSISENSLADADSGKFPEPENILLADGSDGSASMSAPTYLMQADVLQAIGSFISVRSDTFRIRSYGQSLDPISGQVVAKVWYEAIVQRFPEPVNPSSDSPEDPNYWTALDSSGDPQPFGRRFKVLSIRQLSADEV